MKLALLGEWMIECLNKEQKLEGYIDKKQYLDKKKRLRGYLDGNRVKDKGNYTLLILRADGTITYGEELEEEVQGKLSENKILNLNGVLIFEFLKEKRQIVNVVGKLVLLLNGPTREIEELENIDFFGVATILLELFA